MDVAVDAGSLLPGDYYGQVRVRASLADNSPQTISVLMTVLPAGSNPGPEVRPTGLVFTGAAGSTPPAQDVTISNVTGQTVSYNSGRLTDSGQMWFDREPVTASVVPGQPARMIVQSDFATLAPGIRRGALTLLFDDSAGTIRTVSLLTVAAPTSSSTAGGLKAGREASGCNPKRLLPEFASLRPGFSVAQLQPVTVEVKVVDDCGDPLTSGTLVGGISSADRRVDLTHIGSGRWVGTWTPRDTTQSQVRISATAFLTRGAAILDGQVEIAGTVRAGSSGPSVARGAVINAASGQGEYVSPGGYVSIYGSKLADGSELASTTPLPTVLSGAEVMIDEQPLAIRFTSDAQINALIPYDLAVNNQHQIVVRRGNTLSVPETVVLAAAQPGIYTQDQSGKGAGIIVHFSDNQLITAASPAARGEPIVIYCNGLGAVDPPVSNGAPAPLSGPISYVTNPVEVWIGGKRAQYTFAGLTPGIAGLYQVNTVVPDDITPGIDVPVVLKVAGLEGPPVTVAVR